MIDWISENIVGIIFLCLTAAGITSCVRSDWFQEGQAEDRRKEAREAQPHVIREADGCKVYAFKSSGSLHYFTRCPANTTTERTYTETCGKNCTAHKSETLITESKP